MGSYGNTALEFSRIAEEARQRQQMPDYFKYIGTGAESLQSQFNLVKGLQDRILNQNPDVTSGIYGEEARYKRNLGTNLAVAGADIGGTAGRVPLFSAGAEFAARRMSARNAAEQAKILNLLGLGGQYGQISSGYLNLGQAESGRYFNSQQLRLQRDQQAYDQAFNIGDILGLFSFSKTL